MSDVSRDIELMAYRIGRVVLDLKKGIEAEGVTGVELDEATKHLEAAESALLTWAEANKYLDMETL